MQASVSKHKIPSHPQYVRLLRRYLFRLCYYAGFSLKEAANIKLAFTEALNNIIMHVYNDETDHPIVVEFHVFQDRIEIFIRDFGRKVARSDIKSRPLTEFSNRGLGVHIMESLMDYINYDTTPVKGTLLKMVKKREL